MKRIIVLWIICTSFLLHAQEIPLVYPQKILGGTHTIEKNESGQFGVKDGKGAMVLPFIYNRIIEHPTGLVVFRQNKTTGYERTYSCGFFSKSLKLVLPCNYSSVVPSEDGTLVACQNKDHLYGLVDTLGRILVPFKYAEMAAPSEKLLCVKYETKYGYIDQHDRIIIPFKFQFALPFSEGFAVATTGTLFGFIDKKGHFEIPEKFTGANDFENGYAEVFINDEASVVDPKGKILFPFLFRSIRALENNHFWFEAPISYRGQLKQLLLETPISDKRDQQTPEVDPQQENDDLDDLYNAGDGFVFQGILTKEGLILGGEKFCTVSFICSNDLQNLYSVQLLDEIEQKENWNFALMNHFGKIITPYEYLDIRYDEKRRKIFVSVETETSLEELEMGFDGKIRR